MSSVINNNPLILAELESLRQRLAECQQKNKELNLDAAIGRVPLDSKDFEWEKRLAECQKECESLRAERDELQVTLGYEQKYKSAYIELSGKTGELEGRIIELTNEVCKVQAERDHFNRERDIWVRANKKLQEECESLRADAERDELVELLDHALNYTCCAAYSPSLTQEINAALAKAERREAGQVGADKGEVEQDLNKCPSCGGPADNGFSREIPPSPYYCTKCMEKLK